MLEMILMAILCPLKKNRQSLIGIVIEDIY